MKSSPATPDTVLAALRANADRDKARRQRYADLQSAALQPGCEVQAPHRETDWQTGELAFEDAVRALSMPDIWQAARERQPYDAMSRAHDLSVLPNDLTLTEREWRRDHLHRELNQARAAVAAGDAAQAALTALEDVMLAEFG